MNNISPMKLMLTAGLTVLVAGGAVWYFMTQDDADPAETEQEQFVVSLPFIDFPPTSEAREGFVAGMEELGYVEGENVVYMRSEAIAPSPEGLQEAREIYRQRISEDPDLIFANANPDVMIALEEIEAAGKDIPVVASDTINPIEAGFAESYDSSNSNFTGVFELRHESIGRFLDIATTIVPDISTMGILSDGFMSGPAFAYLEVLHEEAENFDIEIVELSTDVPPDPIDNLREEMVRILDGIDGQELDSFTHMPGHYIGDQQVYEHAMARRAGIPFVVPSTVEVDPETGEQMGMIAYGSDVYEEGKQVSVMANKILEEGLHPGEIPLESSESFNLVINLGIAEEIGIDIAPEHLQLADIVIE